MPQYMKTVATIGAEYIQHRLRLDEPETKVRRGIAGRLILSPRWDIRVHIIPRKTSVKLFATGSLLGALLTGNNSFAYDERLHFEKRYAEWLKDRFGPLILDSGAKPAAAARKPGNDPV
ncbi:MAG TPA: hypothetical protein PKE12_02700 [Kiritimatiellia bacterium]|nr:hypothetical protein [Kiritimatiellia bacterium]